MDLCPDWRQIGVLEHWLRGNRMPITTSDKMNTSRTTPARPHAHGAASAPRLPLRGASLLNHRQRVPPRVEASIVAAVEPSTVRATAETAALLARDLRAPLTFVSVRPRPPARLG